MGVVMQNVIFICSSIVEALSPLIPCALHLQVQNSTVIQAV